MATFPENYNNEDNINEPLGSETTGGVLQNEELLDGNHLDLDGVNDHFTVGTMGNVGSNLDEVTMSAWVKTTDTQDQDILGIVNDGANTMLSWDLNLGSVSNQSGRMRLYMRDDNDNRLWGYTTSSTGYNDGTWHHLIVVAKKSTATVTFYVDGVKYSTGYVNSGTGTVFSNFEYPVSVGGRQLRGTVDLEFDGGLADVRFYNTIHTDDEARQLYVTGVGKEDFLVSRWRANEGTGTSIADSTGTNDGTLVDGTWVTDGEVIGVEESRTTSDNMLSASATPSTFDYITAKKPANTNSRVVWSPDYDTQRENVLDFEGSVSNVDITGVTTTTTYTLGFTANLSNERSNQYIFDSLTGRLIVGVHGGGDVLGLYDGSWNDSSVVVRDGKTRKYLIVSDGTGSTTKVYIDNELAISISGNVAIGGATRIGNRNDGVSNGVDGFVADCFLYNTAVSDSERDSIFNGELPTNGLVNHWKLDEGTGTTANDSVGTDDGTINNASWYTDKNYAHYVSDWVNSENASIKSGAYSYDIGSDYTDLGNDTGDFGTGDFSIMTKVKISPSNSGAFSTYMYGDSGTGGSNVRIGNDGSSIFRVFIDDGTNTARADASIDYRDNEWYTVMITRTSTTLSLYVDGTLVDSADASSVGDISETVNERTLIGVENSGGTLTNHFVGSVGETMLYSEALSETDAWNYSTYSIYPDDTNLKAHYRFNGNAHDETGNYDGTVNGAELEQNFTQLPQAGHSMLGTDTDYEVASFDGTDDYVDIGNSNDFSFGDGTTDSPFSISAWINMRDATSFRLIAKADSPGTPKDCEWFLGTNPSDQLSFALYDNGTNDNASTLTTSALTSYENQWIHVVATYDGTNPDTTGMKLYIDSVAQSTTDGSTGSYVAMHNTTEPVNIGRIFPTSSTTYADGSISNVAIFGSELSQGQVSEIFERGWVDKNDPDLISYYPLAGDYNDKIGTNHGTNSGSTFVKDIDRPMGEFDITPENLLDFNGTSTYIDTGSTPALSATDDWTIEATIKLDEVTSDQRIFSQYLASSGNGRMLVYVTGGEVRFFAGDIGTFGSLVLSGDITAGVYHDIKVTRVGNTFSLYLNEVLLDSVTEGSTRSILQTGNIIGASHGSNPPPYNARLNYFVGGIIANVKVSDDTNGDREYKLDEGSGTTATDSAGSFDGTISNGTWTTGTRPPIFDGTNGTQQQIALSNFTATDTWYYRHLMEGTVDKTFAVDYIEAFAVDAGGRFIIFNRT